MKRITEPPETIYTKFVVCIIGQDLFKISSKKQ